MKMTGIISLLWFSFLFSFCAESNITETNLEDGLNFYLLKDSTLTSKDLVNVNIEALTIADKPFLHYTDLDYYKWDEHTFSIDTSKVKILKKIFERNPTLFGTPFVVTVNKERIYLAAFWSSYSSIAPAIPFIEEFFDFEENPEILKINKSTNSKNLDLRNDNRIFSTLKTYGLLLE